MKKMTPDQVRDVLTKGAKCNGIGPVDMPATDYHGMVDYTSHSVLKKIKDSPSKFLWEMNNPRPPSQAMSIGTAVHAALLEPDYFEATYRVRRDKPKEPERPAELADVTRRSKEGAAAIAAWEATWKPKYDAELAAWESERESSVMVSHDEMELIKRVHYRASNDAFLSQFMVGWRESSFFARDAEIGKIGRAHV